MSRKRSHYKAPTKAGFSSGELVALLASHGPEADYRVVISFRGRVRELIVEEDNEGRKAVVECAGDDRSVNWHRAKEGLPPYQGDDQRHGGKAEAAFHPWPAAENLQ